MPHYALENATAGEAWGWVWRSIANEKKEFFVYVLLRLVLPTVATVALLIVLLHSRPRAGRHAGAIVYAIHGSFADATGASQSSAFCSRSSSARWASSFCCC